MSTLIAIVAAAVVVLAVKLALTREPVGDGDERSDPVERFLIAADEQSEDLEPASRRLLTTGPSAAGRLGRRLRDRDPLTQSAQARLAIERLTVDFGLAGVRALATELRPVERTHAAVPALVRVAAAAGTGSLDALRQHSADVRALVALRQVAENPALVVSASGADTHPILAAALGERAPVSIAGWRDRLPGSRSEALSVDEITDDSGVDLETFRALTTGANLASSWTDAFEPTDVASMDWLRWAVTRLDDSPVREKVRKQALSDEATSNPALAVLSRVAPDAVADVLRDRRRRGVWVASRGPWLRHAVTAAGGEARRSLVESLVSVPSVSAVGSECAALDPGEDIGPWLDAWSRGGAPTRTMIDACLRSGGARVEQQLIETVLADDDPRRRSAVELCGRLRLRGAGPDIVSAGGRGPIDANLAAWSLEMIGRAPSFLPETAPAPLVRSVELLRLLERAT